MASSALGNTRLAAGNSRNRRRSTQAAPSDSRQVVDVDLDIIDPDPGQPRRNFAKNRLVELSVSIKEKGVLEPITVCAVGKRYRIVKGERRYRASTLAKKDTIPAFIIDVDEAESYELALIENIQREDMTPLEEADGVVELMRRRNYKQVDVVRVLGMTKSAVSKYVAVAGLSEPVRKKVSTAKLGLDQLYQIARQGDEGQQAELVREVVAGGLKTAATRERAREVSASKRSPGEKKPARPTSSKDVAAVERIISTLERIDTLAKGKREQAALRKQLMLAKAEIERMLRAL